MELQKAIDDFLFHLEVEKNCSPNTLRGYAFDLGCFVQFVKKVYDSASFAKDFPKL